MQQIIKNIAASIIISIILLYTNFYLLYKHKIDMIMFGTVIKLLVIGLLLYLLYFANKENYTVMKYVIIGLLFFAVVNIERIMTIIVLWQFYGIPLYMERINNYFNLK